MLKNYSKQVISIIELSKNIAKKLECEYVGTEHVILAMYETEDTICRFLLQENEINMDQLLDIYYQYVNGNKEKETSCYQEMIKEASNVAISNKSKYVFDEHLFYAILENEDSTGYKMINGLGLDIESLIYDIEDIFNFDLYEEEMEPFLINLSTSKKIHHYINRSNYIERIIYILNKKQKNNPLLIGNAGVGKTAIVEGLASKLKGETIYQLNLASAVSNTKYRGELEEKIIKVMEFIKTSNAILFIDEIHNVVGAGSNDGSLDIANLLKPYLARSDIKCIGATTLEEYYHFIAKDKALMRRFQNIFIDEPSLLETKRIINGIIGQYETYHKIKYPKKLVNKIIKMADRYLPSRTFPDKVIDIIDEVGSRVRQNKKQNLEEVTNKVIQDMTGITSISFDKLSSIKLNYPELKRFFLPFLLLMENSLPHLVVAKVKKDFQASFLLSDLEKIFHFKQEMYLEINLETYTDITMINNLIGSPKGYVGYEQGGILSEHLLKYPISCIYFKNLDKAVYSIKDYIEKIFHESKIIDSKSRVISLKNAIFLYNDEEMNMPIGFSRNKVLGKEVSYDIALPSYQLKPKNNQEYLSILKKNKIEIKEGAKLLNKNLVYDLLVSGRGVYQLKDENKQIKYYKIG